MLRVENVATPATAATVVVPVSVPASGFVSIATVTSLVNPVAVFPCASRAVTCSAGEIVAPAVVLVGSTVNTRWLAAPGAMLKAALVAVVRPAALAANVYPVPVLLMLTPENVATPATAATVVVPDRVPLPGLVPIASVTLPVNPVTVFPWASRAVICTAGLIAAPATASLGGTVNTSWLAVPAVMSNGALVPVATLAAVAASV